MRRFLLGAMAAVLMLSGCGGGSGSTSSTPAATGVFSDAPVEGLRYVFGRYSGVTGSGGTFTYQPGTAGVFRLGDIVIGRSAGGPVITPVDLIKTAHPEYSDQQAQNGAVTLVRFLTSIGGGPDQAALTIPGSLLGNARGAVFRNADLLTSDLQVLLASLGGFTLTSQQAASDHLTAALANLSLARQAGEYVTAGSSDRPLYLKIDSNGNVTGSRADSSGADTFSGTVDASGIVALGNPPGVIARNNGFSASGSSNTKGAISGSFTLEGDPKTYHMNLHRVTAATNPYAGIFTGSYTGSATGTWNFGIDAEGTITGWELQEITGGGRNGTLPAIQLLGKVDMQTGNFELKGTGVTFSGTISGSAVSGTWSGGTESGSFSGSMIGG